MGVYQRWIVPRLVDLAMRNRLLEDYRQQAIGAARGLVLEIGVGSGLNLPLYGHVVDHVRAIDTSLELLRLAHERTADAVVPVSLLRASAEHLPFGFAVFDTIVMTWTLCSIVNPIAALMEMRRILKSGGQLLFVERPPLIPPWLTAARSDSITRTSMSTPTTVASADGRDNGGSSRRLT